MVYLLDASFYLKRFQWIICSHTSTYSNTEYVVMRKIKQVSLPSQMPCFASLSLFLNFVMVLSVHVCNVIQNDVKTNNIHHNFGTFTTIATFDFYAKVYCNIHWNFVVMKEIPCFYVFCTWKVYSVIFNWSKDKS